MFFSPEHRRYVAVVSCLTWPSNVFWVCSRKRFSEKQAEQWWAENRARVYEQYNVRMVERSSVGVGNDEALH